MGRPPLVLLVALLAALASGAAASLLIGAATSPGAPPPHVTSIVVPDWLIGYAFLAGIVALVGFFIYRRVEGGAMPVPGRVAATLLLVILVAVLFLAALRVFGGGGPGPEGAVPPPHGNTTGVVVNNTTANATTPLGGNGSFLLWSPNLPPWLPFVVVVAVILVVVVVAVPQVRQYVSYRRELRRARPSGARPLVVAEVQDALARAAGDLERGGDPRAVIVALYGSLLDRLAPLVGSTDPDTPEEIRTLHLVRLGIRVSAATDLTRLFEEARYSSHPMGPDAADAARRAVREALADLARVPLPG